MSKYNAVIEMLLSEARAQGYSAHRFEDEEEVLWVKDTDTDAEIISWALGVEQSKLSFRNPTIPAGMFGHVLHFYIVLGNEPGETIADFTDHGTAERIAVSIENAFS